MIVLLALHPHNFQFTRKSMMDIKKKFYFQN